MITISYQMPAWFADPFNAGIKQFSLASRPNPLSKKLVHYVVGSLLLTPLINTVVYLAVKRFFPDLLADQAKISPPIVSKASYKTQKLPFIPAPDSKHTPPKLIAVVKPKSIHDLADQTLGKIFSGLDIYELGNIAQVCKKFNSIQSQAPAWKAWLNKYHIPLAANEDPYQKTQKLLRHFKEDPVNQTLTLVRKGKTGTTLPETIKGALAIYPFPAWLVVATPDPHIFHLYFRNELGQVGEFVDVDKTCLFSARLMGAKKIMIDHQFVQLKLE